MGLPLVQHITLVRTATLLSFEQLIHLDYFTRVWWRVGWWRGGFLVASWLVAKLPGGEMTGKRRLHYCYSFCPLFATTN